MSNFPSTYHVKTFDPREVARWVGSIFVPPLGTDGKHSPSGTRVG